MRQQDRRDTRGERGDWEEDATELTAACAWPGSTHIHIRPECLTKPADTPVRTGGVCGRGVVMCCVHDVVWSVVLSHATRRPAAC